MLRTYRLALSQADAAYVSFSDQEGLKTMRKHFLEKKLNSPRNPFCNV